jgi:hypothetical protein
MRDAHEGDRWHAATVGGQGLLGLGARTRREHSIRLVVLPRERLRPPGALGTQDLRAAEEERALRLLPHLGLRRTRAEPERREGIGGGGDKRGEHNVSVSKCKQH